MHKIKFNKEKDMLHQIATASEAIRRKHRLLKTGKEEMQKEMSEVFKPVVTPLQKLVNQSVKQELSIKQEPVKEEPVDDRFMERENISDDDASEHEYDTADDDDEDDLNKTIRQDSPEKQEEAVSPARYLKMFDSVRKKELDTAYGVRRRDNTWVIGDSRIDFDKNTINIGNKTYHQTRGLLELLFKKTPLDEYIGQQDIANYREIVRMTNAHRKYYEKNNDIRESTTSKFRNIIVPIVKSPEKRRRRSGKALPSYKTARKSSHMDYVYWDDPNELVDRLRLLIASQAAGNTSHSNEIISIIEELREAGVIY